MTCGLKALLLLTSVALVKPRVAELAVDHGLLEDELECPPPNTKFWSKQVGWGARWRAHRTMVPGLRIAPSPMPNAGLGVFADTFIRKYTWLGEYEGEIVSANPGVPYTGTYAWAIYRGGKLNGYVDGFFVDRSSYLRFVNMPTRLTDVNVEAFACLSKVFYMVTRDVYPGQELLVNYGLGYARQLKLDINVFHNISGRWRDAGLDFNNATQLKLLTGQKFKTFAQGHEHEVDWESISKKLKIR